MQAISSNYTPRRISTISMSGEGGLYGVGPNGLLSPDLTSSANVKQEAYVEGNVKFGNTIECPFDVMSIRFSPDGSHLAVGLIDGSIKIHSSEDGKLLHNCSDDDTTSKKVPVTSIHFRIYQASDKVEHKHMIMATYASGLVKFWHYTSGKCVHTIDEQRQTLASCYNPLGTKFVTAGANPQLHLYDEATKKQLRIFEPGDAKDQMDGHRFRVLAVQYNPSEPNMFISGGWDDTVQFWDERMKHAVRKLYGPHICGDALDIDPTYNHILTGSWRKNNVLQIWDFSTGGLVKNVPMDPLHTSLLYCAQWLGKENMVCAGSDQNLLRVIDRGTLNTVGQLVQLPQGVYCLDNDRTTTRQPRIACGSKNKAYILRVEKK